MTTTAWTRQDSEALSVDLVARDGHRLPLRGDERAAAVTRMVANGVPAEVIAARLCITPTALDKFACRRGISLKTRPAPGWWVAVAAPSSTKRHQAVAA